jgi:glycosyltransferase involved in cell wall biosynthesis
MDSRRVSAEDRAEAADDGAPVISVIIPALNEASMIGKCLASLSQTRFPRSRFEVVVADNGSTDRTLDVVQSFSAKLDVKVLQQPGVTISALRNLGAGVARGKVLAFLDADCVVPESWLADVARQMSAGPERVIGSRYRIPERSSWVARSWYGVCYPPLDGEVTYVPSGDLVILQSAFDRIGGFDEELATSEDCEFCLRARAAGMPVHAIAELAVIHLGTPQTLAQFYRKHRWHGMHVAKVFVQNMGSVPHLRAVANALFFLICSVGLLAGAGVGLAIGRYWMMAVPLAAVFGFSFLCSIRKLRGVPGRDFWPTLSPLTVLYFIYGMARANALLMASKRTSGRESKTCKVREATHR